MRSETNTLGVRRETSTLVVRSEISTLGVKKIIIIILGWLLFLAGFDVSFAITEGSTNFDINAPVQEPWSQYQYSLPSQWGTATSWDNSLGNEAGWDGGSGGPTEVMVTEEIPGMNCTKEGTGIGPESKKYKCTIQPGFGSVMAILSGLIKYATFITALVGVLMLVVSGIMYSMSGANSKAKTDATEHLQKVILGLVLLFLVGFVLNTVAPWIYR